MRILSIGPELLLPIWLTGIPLWTTLADGWSCKMYEWSKLARVDFPLAGTYLRGWITGSDRCNATHLDKCEATKSLIQSLDISISLNNARIDDSIRFVGRNVRMCGGRSHWSCQKWSCHDTVASCNRNVTRYWSMDSNPPDEETALPVNPQAQRSRTSVPSLLFIGSFIVLYLLTSHNGDEFLARHHYQAGLQSLTFQLLNYSAWMDGTASNFSMVRAFRCLMASPSNWTCSQKQMLL